MKFLPFERFTIISNKRLCDLYESIDQSCEEFKLSSYIFGNKKPLVGYRSGCEFELRRAIRYANPFLPIARGIISTDNNTHEIVVTLRPEKSSMVFIIIWQTFVLMTAVLIVLKNFNIASLVAISPFFVFGYLFMQIPFWVEVPKIKKILYAISE